MYLFDITVMGGNTYGTIALQFLVYSLIQHIPLLITFVVCFSIIAVHNQNKFGNHLLVVSMFGTIYSVLLLIFDMAIFYWILGLVPIYIALTVSFAALIMFIITFFLMFIIGVKSIDKYFALAGFCFLLEYFIYYFIWFLFI